jgi:hypothetical protein
VREDATCCKSLPDEGLPLVGAEPISASLEAPIMLRHSQLKSAAKSDAIDVSLQELVDSWPELPEAVRGAILVMVRAAVPQ